MDHAGLLHSGSCTTHTSERKRAEKKLLTAKPNLLTENEHAENDSEICATVCNKDDVINLGEYNIDDDTTLMMTAIVQPSTKRGGRCAALRYNRKASMPNDASENG